MSVQSVSIAEISASKIYVPDNRVFSFKHPMDYVQGFLEILEPFGVDVQYNAKIGAINKENTQVIDGLEMPDSENISYSSLIAKAKLPEQYDILPDVDNIFNHLNGEIGFVFNFEGAAPQIRAYAGNRVTVCSNGCIFGANNIVSLNLVQSSNTTPIYDQLKKYAEDATVGLTKYKERIERMNEEVVSGLQLEQKIGKIFWYCKNNKKLGVTPALDMLTYLQDNKSAYALQEGTTTDWKLYNALTQSIKKSNLIDESARVLLLEKIFNYN